MLTTFFIVLFFFGMLTTYCHCAFLSLFASCLLSFVSLICLSFSRFSFPAAIVFLSCYLSSFSFLLAFPSLVPSSLFPSILFSSLAFLASFHPSIPYSFLPWYILFPFTWLSLAFYSFPSMFTLLAIIFPYIAL